MGAERERGHSDIFRCGAVATFGTQLGNSLSASEMNGLLNGSATQSQLDMFASRAGESCGVSFVAVGSPDQILLPHVSQVQAFHSNVDGYLSLLHLHCSPGSALRKALMLRC